MINSQDNGLPSNTNKIELLNNSAQMMSTNEISDITGKRHDNVLRDTEQMFCELKIDHLKFEGTYKSIQGKDVKCYKLDKDLTLCLVTKYDTKTRMAIIKRLNELEQAGQGLLKALENSDPLVLQKLADIARQKQQLETDNRLLEVSLESAEQSVKNLTPMAEYGNKVFTSENTYTATNIATELGLRSPILLNRILKSKKIIKKGTGSAEWAICSKYSRYGLTKYIKVPVKTSSGEWETRLQLRWTRKGFDWICDQFNKGNLS
ncbi:MAG: phage regulatory protein/antirepressor Ant [Lentisphaeraceae bacterium]|nr:phage regulatory protein/antirepressor Ant [Lentisphaeraceae bacterium]